VRSRILLCGSVALITPAGEIPASGQGTRVIRPEYRSRSSSSWSSTVAAPTGSPASPKPAGHVLTDRQSVRVVRFQDKQVVMDDLLDGGDGASRITGFPAPVSQIDPSSESVGMHWPQNTSGIRQGSGRCRRGGTCRSRRTTQCRNSKRTPTVDQDRQKGRGYRKTDSSQDDKEIGHRH
jgi:hypothetical protein